MKNKLVENNQTHPTKKQKFLITAFYFMRQLTLVILSIMFALLTYQQLDMYTSLRVDVISIPSSLVAMITYKLSNWLFWRC